MSQHEQEADDEQFIRQYESPTLLYRFLANRGAINPLYLPRTLSYRRARTVAHQRNGDRRGRSSRSAASSSSSSSSSSSALSAAPSSPSSASPSGSMSTLGSRRKGHVSAERLKQIRGLLSSARECRRDRSGATLRTGRHRTVVLRLKSVCRVGPYRSGFDSGVDYRGRSCRLGISLCRERRGRDDENGAMQSLFSVTESRVVRVPVDDVRQRGSDPPLDANMRLQFSFPVHKEGGFSLIFHFLDQDGGDGTAAKGGVGFWTVRVGVHMCCAVGCLYSMGASLVVRDGSNEQQCTILLLDDGMI